MSEYCMDELSDDALLYICEFLSTTDVYLRFGSLNQRTHDLIFRSPRIVAREKQGPAMKKELLQMLFDYRIAQKMESNLCEIFIENASNIDQEFADRFLFSQERPIFANLTRLTLKNSNITHVRLSVEECVLEYLDLSSSKHLDLLEFVVDAQGSVNDHLAPKSVPLKTLILDGCEHTFISVNTAAFMPRLEHASFARATWVDDSELEAFLQFWTKLRHLNLRACKGVGDIAMNFIADHLPELESLILDDTSVGDHGLQRFANAKVLQVVNNRINSRPLRELSLSGCRLTNKSIANLAQLSKLERLSLCKQNVDLLEPLSQMRHIHHLNLAFVHINDEQLESLTRALDLISLNLSFCKFITDESMKHIAAYCHKLRHLDISHARRISNVGLQYLMESKVLSLLHLHCSYCSPTLNQQSVEMFKKRWRQCVVRFEE